MKIVYCGLQYDLYNPKRGVSFEHQNIYSSLREFPGAEVRYFPLERILEKGKARWNEELVEAVRAERPDLFFCFMFADEFDPGALAEIQTLAPTLAWFADDHHRFHNYTRKWAPLFSWSVTTYSKAVEKYRAIGYASVIRSQWACNPGIFRPIRKGETIDVSFVGTRNAERDEILRRLQKEKIPVAAYGGGFGGGRISVDEMVRIFSMSRINLGLNPPTAGFRLDLSADYFGLLSLGKLFLRRSVMGKIPDLWGRGGIGFSLDVLRFPQNLKAHFAKQILQIKARHFEIPACGGFLVTEMADDLDRYYTPGKEIVVYDGLDDMIEKIRYYLTHDAERRAIARASYERTIREHTYQRRFSEIFRAIGLRK